MKSESYIATVPLSAANSNKKVITSWRNDKFAANIASFLNKTTTDRPIDRDPPTSSHRVYSEDLAAASAFVRVDEKDSPLACPYLDKHPIQRRAARSFCRNSTQDSRPEYANDRCANLPN
ncbi:Uncharacterized protein DBV15_04115 [Temnothorax longispinosus]|uniref:Uncharacterized protein n=1 Tax=Temnothorax longispinosus TaxID=300112 RepID=A0A4S2KH12_9HYME|nr:Uncharacterized protein DBV15_04115 [Temnothorax longispinosus]